MVEQETEETELKNLKLEKLKAEVSFDYHSSRFFSLLFLAIYIVAVTIFCIEYRIIPGPEFLVLGILFVAAYSKQTWSALKDWLPFITVFLSYEVMYSFVGIVSSSNLHSGPQIIDTSLFGQPLSLTLQQTVRLPILDYMGAVFYGIYFFVPTVFAYVVWKKSPKNYWKYTVAFGVLTYSALITFLFYPVAPPWFQYNSAFNPTYSGPQVIRILTGSVDVQLHLPVYKTLFDFLSPNLYAAFPSMHSAMPWLVFLFAFRIWKWKSLPVAIIPVGTWFSAVYLGEHYFTDVVGGIVYATVAYFAVVKLLPYVSDRINFLQKHVPKEKKAESSTPVSG
ncbi:MAG: phosphatase PAP2 family protein [Candidatus Bathyarchaeia archaeon]|jgi:membrane-associated phospholipid phosphatase